MGLVKYLIAILLILIPATSLADTHNAASCSVADINTQITAATSGDTVAVPAGECTWATTLSIPANKTIHLVGAGSASTKISFSGTAISSLSADSSISGFWFYKTGDNASPLIEIKNKGFRIHHNKIEFSYNNYYKTRYTPCILATGSNVTMTPEGLVDNNTTYGCNMIVTGAGNITTQNAAWYEASAIGTDNAVYFEDNTIERGDVNSVIFDAYYGAKLVVRYNTLDGANGFTHSMQPAESARGVKSWEIYGNNWTIPSQHVVMTTIIGGTGMIFNNYATAAMTGTLVMNIRDQRAEAGNCNGSDTIDSNELASGWVCRDQLGTGPDSSKGTSTIPAGTNITKAPAYFWSNYRSTGATIEGAVAGTSATWVIENRDFFDYDTTFDGTTGTGCGTLAARPATCTTGVGYWATNQSCTSMTGMVGPSPSTPISGSLYKCVDNAWEESASYTPLAYPHPLRGETGDETAPTLVSATINAAGTSLYLVFTEPVTVNTNTGFVLTATGSPTLTYASGTGTATLIYTIGAAVPQSESGITLAYTTGANYIEDAAGNDLDSFTGTAVVNHSTQNTPPTVELTVTKTGSGCTVTSAPSGVNCGSTCTVSVDNGTVVTLSGWSENGWNAITYGGDCAANGTVTMNAAKECTATCTQVQLFP